MEKIGQRLGKVEEEMVGSKGMAATFRRTQVEHGSGHRRRQKERAAAIENAGEDKESTIKKRGG